MSPPCFRHMSIINQKKRKFNTRVCLKNHSRNLHAPLCGRFHPNSVAVA
ncbi:DUF6783 domain-containing protein, partial [Ruminococcus sp. 1001136sp1_2201st1_G3_2201SCRN_220225]